MLPGTSVLSAGAAAALTPAGTVLCDRTFVSFSVSGLQQKSASNSVTITIGKVTRVAIDAPKTATLKPGETAPLTHTITNQGNAPDTYNLEATLPAGFTARFYAADGTTPLTDTNGDGRIDTGLVAAGGAVTVVAKVIAPADSPSGTFQPVVKAASAGDATASAVVTESLTVSVGLRWAPLVMSVTPTGQVPPGSILTYTGTIGHDGNSDATGVIIADHLDPNLSYLAGSAAVSGGSGGTVAYDAGTNSISWKVPSIPAGATTSVTFKARVYAAINAEATIPNTLHVISDQNREAQVSNTVTTPVVEQPLRVTIKALKTAAEVGEFVPYAVTVENVSKGLHADRVQVLANFPEALRYAQGTSSLDGAPVTDPPAGATVTWGVGSLEPGQKKTLTCRALVSVGAPQGDVVTSASSAGTSPGGNALVSPTASATVKIVEGALNSKATILGRVFIDANGDLMPDAREPGIQGARLYLEDGSYVVTDGEGKFSFYAVDAGEHVLKLDRTTVPAGLEPVSLDSTFAGDGGSRFIHVPFGGMARGDFGLQQSTKEKAPKEGEKGVTSKGRYLTFGTEMTPAPFSLEMQAGSMPDTPEILSPANGSVQRRRWTDMVIRVPDGAEYTLRVNGAPLLESQIGKTIVESAKKIRLCQYVGVKLEPGTNTVVLEATRPGGKPELREIEIVAPGDAAKVEITPDKGNIPADGKTVTSFAVRFVDRWSRPANGDFTYTVLSGKGEVVERDLDPTKAGCQLKAVEGKGEFHVRSTFKTGAEHVAVVAGTNLEGGMELFFTPQLRDWIVAGIGSLTVGSGASGDSGLGAAKESGGVQEEGRVAFFGKGTVFGDYLLTAAYDTGKERREKYFQRVEPDRYYPIYGDASVRGYEAESREKAYLKVEKNRSSLLIGDYDTKLSSNEFSRYDRTFNGAKVDVDTKSATVRTFATSTNHSANRDELPGNGTSGYYFLARAPIIENTDKIRIEVRDRYHSERVISVVEKSPYMDYSLDYRTGAVLFREPVPSDDANLNPVRIVAVYESEAPGDDHYIYGGRGAVRSAAGSELGITAVKEDNGAGSYSLYGVDGIARVNDKTSVKVEGARSESPAKGTGTAYKAELATQLEKGLLGVYYRKVGRTFDNTSMTGTEVGTEKYGAKVSYRLLERTSLFAEGFVQSDLINSARLTSITLGGAQQIEKFTVDYGYRFLRGNDDRGLLATSHLFSAGVGGKVTEKLDASLLQEQALSSRTVKDYPSRTVLKLNYKVTETTSAFVTEELRESGGAKGNNAVAGISTRLRENMVVTTSYQETTGAEQNRQVGTEVASRWDPARNVVVNTKTGYQIQNSLTGDRGQALLGVDASWEVAKGVRVGARGERVQVVTGSYDPNAVNNAVALSAEYIPREEVKATGRYEFRRSPGETANLYALGGAWKASERVSLLGKMNLWTSEKGSGTDLLFDGELGGAYRPPGSNAPYLLGVLRFKEDRRLSVAPGEIMESLIGSIEGSQRVRPSLTVHAKYAGKFSWDTLYGQQVQAYSDMIIGGGTYDLTPRWDVDLSARFLNQYQAGVSALGVVPQVGYRLCKNLRVAVGYNLSRLNDRDLTEEGYSRSGPFVAMKGKFDEITIRDLYEKMKGKPRPAPPPPPPRPLALLVRAKLVEEPVEIRGSAESLKVLVNDREALLETADVKLGVETVDDVLELKGNSRDKPVTFQVTASVAERIASWSLVVATLGGDVLHLARGTGAPPPVVPWDDADGALAALKGGEVYQYRLELRYADGGVVTSPFRVFGLNRTSTVSLSLSGGAFLTGSAVLSKKARAILKRAAGILRANSEEKVVVEGHTDSVGSNEANLELSRMRSQSAADYLVTQEKIPAGRLIVRWYGKTRPVASNAIPEGRELNRRVDIRGEFSETSRAVVLDQHREPPFAKLNGKAVTLDESGRFASSLSGADRIDIEMGSSSGRSAKKTLSLPKVALVQPGDEGSRRVLPGEGQEKAPRVSTAYRFTGTVPPRCTLAVDGKEVPVAADGTFGFTLEVAEGEGTYWLLVRTPEGHGTVFRLLVSVKREPPP